MTLLHTATDKQRETLVAVVRAGSIKAAALQLRVPERTVKNRLSALYRRLKVENIAQAAYLLGIEDARLN